MGIDSGMWPRNRWELTAPESYALLYGPKRAGAQIFKLALLELVSRKLLTLVNATNRGFLSTRSIALLNSSPGEQEAPRSRSLQAVLELLDGGPPDPHDRQRRDRHPRRRRRTGGAEQVRLF
ncbi:MAG: hypothetical protein H0X71_03770 [Rubrobacter sp.]|nr:hypothetical protein [Rubrobacter sp.]